jgi:hypothetical protein
MALLKLTYLATRNIERKWTVLLQNRSITVSRLSVIFGEQRRRLPYDLPQKRRRLPLLNGVAAASFYSM